MVLIIVLFKIKLLLYRGQAEKEFRVEVEAIGHVRHKNLVRLLGYCIEGVHRYYSFCIVSQSLDPNFVPFYYSNPIGELPL